MLPVIQEALNEQLTEFDEEHAVTLLLIRRQDDDTRQIVVVIRYFLLRRNFSAGALRHGRSPITFEKKPKTWSRCESASVRM